jgi:hypothetical protein
MRSTFLHIPLVIFKKVTRVLAACALTACMGVANASSTYDFYWCDLASGNEVFGYITGLQDIEGRQAATSVVTLPNDIMPTEINYVTDSGYRNYIGGLINIFELDTEGNIIFSYFEAIPDLWSDLSGFTLRVNDYASTGTWQNRLYSKPEDCQTPLHDISYCLLSTSGVAQFARRIEIVTEPGSVILLSLGLAGLAFSRYRKQS